MDAVCGFPGVNTTSLLTTTAGLAPGVTTVSGAEPQAANATRASSQDVQLKWVPLLNREVVSKILNVELYVDLEHSLDFDQCVISISHLMNLRLISRVCGGGCLGHLEPSNELYAMVLSSVGSVIKFGVWVECLKKKGASLTDSNIAELIVKYMNSVLNVLLKSKTFECKRGLSSEFVFDDFLSKLKESVSKSIFDVFLIDRSEDLPLIFGQKWSTTADERKAGILTFGKLRNYSKLTRQEDLYGIWNALNEVLGDTTVLDSSDDSVDLSVDESEDQKVDNQLIIDVMAKTLFGLMLRKSATMDRDALCTVLEDYLMESFWVLEHKYDYLGYCSFSSEKAKWMELFRMALKAIQNSIDTQSAGQNVHEGARVNYIEHAIGYLKGLYAQ